MQQSALELYTLTTAGADLQAVSLGITHWDEWGTNSLLISTLLIKRTESVHPPKTTVNVYCVCENESWVLCLVHQHAVCTSMFISYSYTQY